MPTATPNPSPTTEPDPTPVPLPTIPAGDMQPDINLPEVTLPTIAPDNTLPDIFMKPDNGLITVDPSLIPKMITGGTVTITGGPNLLEAEVSGYTPTPNPEKLTYQWFRNGVQIPGATSSKYNVMSDSNTLGSPDGATFSVSVILTHEGYANTLVGASVKYPLQQQQEQPQEPAARRSTLAR